VQAFNGFLGKTDGRDKLCATIQVCGSWQQTALPHSDGRAHLLISIMPLLRSACCSGLQQRMVLPMRAVCLLPLSLRSTC